MDDIKFVHLHLHSDGSLLDGSSKVKKYVLKAKELGHPAVALTDHGNTIMLYQFYKQCKEIGVKPILGCEFYLTTNLENKIPNKQRDLLERDKHLIVLIKNEQGYKNFCKLNYLSYSQGFYYKPRVSYDMLFEHKEGLVVCSACAAGISNQLITGGRYNEADEWVKKFKKEFGEDFYIEVQFNEVIGNKEEEGIDQKEINDKMIELAIKNKVKIVLTGDVHYADDEDVKLQDILINCQRRKDGPAVELGQSFMHARRLFYQTSQDFFQFNKEFGYNYKEEDVKTWLTNTLEIAEKCNFDFDTKTNHFPKADVPLGTDLKEYTLNLAFKELNKQISDRMNEGEEFSDELLTEYEKRLEYEVSVIADKGYLDYFLVFHDLVKWCDRENIYRGVARGSAGGSLLSMALGITSIDPIKFKLYFERFLNPERTAFPDIDCLGVNNYVLLNDNSYKKIEEVKEGMLIKTETGESEVVYIQSRKLKEKENLYKITLENGSVIEVTENHKIPILREGERLELKFKDIKENDLFLIDDLDF